MSWTDDHETKLRNLAERGYSAAQIADRLPVLPASLKRPVREVTKDMVVGKARRMGIQLKGGIREPA